MDARSKIAAWQPKTERAARAQEALLWALRPMEEGGSSMALEARSPAVSMDTTPLSQAQTARLLAAECYRLKSEARVLDVQQRILEELRDREKSLHILSRERLVNLSDTIIEMIAKIATFERQVYDLGEKMIGALSQASLSVLSTDDTGKRLWITEGLEPQDFKDGAVLIKEGEPRDALFIIVEGQVSCTQRRRHRCEVGAARAALLERLSALAPLGLPAPRCSARQGCASRREAQSATKGPCGASRL
jgi:hypothetical protein